MLVLATFPLGRVLEVRRSQSPAGGHLRRADVLPTQGLSAKSRCENANKRSTDVELRSHWRCRNSFPSLIKWLHKTLARTGTVLNLSENILNFKFSFETETL